MKIKRKPVMAARSRERPVTATTWGIDDPRSDYLESKNYKKVVFNGRGQYERGYSKQYMTADHRIGSISVNPHDDYAVDVYIMDDRYVDHRIDIPAGVPSNLSADNYENDLAAIEEFLYNYSLNEYGHQRASTSTRKRPVTASEDAGESEEIYYDVCINDNPSGNPVYDLNEAIRIAKEYAEDPDYAEDEITVRMSHYTVDQSGDIDTPYDDDMDVMWNSNDAIYESTQIKAASTRSRKRSIKAADDDPNYGDIAGLAEQSAYSYVVQARNAFSRLLSFVDDILHDEFGSMYDTAGTVSYGGGGSAVFTITPKCDGEWLDDYALNIYYDVLGVEGTEFPGRPYRIVVKSSFNDDVIAYGDNFDDVQVEVAQDIAESCRVHYEEDVTML